MVMVVAMTAMMMIDDNDTDEHQDDSVRVSDGDADDDADDHVDDDGGDEGGDDDGDTYSWR